MLKGSSGGNVAAETYTSRDPDGLITIAYLSPGTYELTEIAAPKGYMVSDAPMEIVVADDGQVTVAGVDDSFYTLTQATDTEMAIIKVKDRTTALTVKKVDADGRPLSGAHFALYAAEDFDDDANTPKAGARALVQGATSAGGILPLGELPAGEYRLVETNAPAGYNLLGTPVKVFVRSDEVAASQGGNDSTVRHLDPEGADTWQIEVWKVVQGSVPRTTFGKIAFASAADTCYYCQVGVCQEAGAQLPTTTAREQLSGQFDDSARRRACREPCIVPAVPRVGGFSFVWQPRGCPPRR